MLETATVPPTKKPTWKWSTVVPIALLFGLPTSLYTAFVAQCYWNWFAASALRLPEISFLQMLGLWWMIDLLIIRTAKNDGGAWELLASITKLCVPPEKHGEMEEMRAVDPFMDFIRAITMVIGNTVALALGFGLHIFIS